MSIKLLLGLYDVLHSMRFRVAMRRLDGGSSRGLGYNIHKPYRWVIILIDIVLNVQAPLETLPEAASVLLLSKRPSADVTNLDCALHFLEELQASTSCYQLHRR